MSQPHRTTKTTAHHNGNAAFGTASIPQDGPDIGSAAAFLDVGLLAITTPAGALVITPDSWKTGISGTWTTGTDWSTGAAPTASSAATIAVPGTYTVAIRSGVAANSLTLDNAAATLDVVSGGTLSLTTSLAATAGTVALSGEIAGGTVSAGSAAVVSFTGGTLDRVTWDGPLTVSGSGHSLGITGGITLLGADGSGDGTLDIVGDPSNRGIATYVGINDNETLNNATLNFGGNACYLDCGFDTSRVSGTLTLGTGFTVNQDSNGTNFLYGFADYTTDLNTIINDGTILVTEGRLSIDCDIFDNIGTISVSSGGSFQVDEGIIDFNAKGKLETSGTGVIFLNTSTVEGTVNASGATIEFTENVHLQDVTWEGPLTMGGPKLYAADASVTGGLTLTGANGSGSGTLNIEGNAKSDNGLYILDNETLNNATLNFIGTNGFLGSGYEDGSYTLTLGSDFLITQSAGANTLSGLTSGQGEQGSLIVNDGAILATGGVLTIYTADFTNVGSITASSGGTVDLTNAFGTLTNAQGTTLAGGTFAADAKGTLLLSQGFDLVTDAATISLSGSASVIESKNSTTGSYVTIDQTLAAIASGGSLELLADRNFKAASGLVDSGMLQLGGGTLAAASGIDVASGGTLSGFGTVTAAVTDNGTVNATNDNGPVLVMTDVTGSGTLSAASGGKVDLVGGGTLSEIVTGAGKLQLDDGSYQLATTLGIAVVIVEAGASLTGPGTVDGAFVNNGAASIGAGTLTFAGTMKNSGTITATGGTAIIDKIAEGAGTLAIGAAGTASLLLGAQASQTVDFLASTGTLDLAAPLDFLGSITGFGAGDIIDLINTPETSYNCSGGVLTITSGTQTEASLHFTGTYTKMDFLPGSDHHGGTQITFV